jgi:hypothetical protein
VTGRVGCAILGSIKCLLSSDDVCNKLPLLMVKLIEWRVKCLQRLLVPLLNRPSVVGLEGPQSSRPGLSDVTAQLMSGLVVWMITTSVILISLGEGQVIRVKVPSDISSLNVRQESVQLVFGRHIFGILHVLDLLVHTQNPVK